MSEEIKRAIEDLKGLNKLLNEGIVVAPTPMTLDLAIIALRQTQVKEPCEWCKIHEEENRNHFGEQKKFDHVFCSHCGRPLKAGD